MHGYALDISSHGGGEYAVRMHSKPNAENEEAFEDYVLPLNVYVSGRKSAEKVLYLSYFHLSVKNPMYTRYEYSQIIASVILLSSGKTDSCYKEVLCHF